MVIRKVLGALQIKRLVAWEASFPNAEQVLRIEPRALRHVRSFRQNKITDLEAGGQLFGSVAVDIVTVHIASGPYRKDERSSCHYRSHPPSAQNAIEKFARSGLVYLGEWHTHAEEYPEASGRDAAAMHAIVTSSQLSTSSLLLLIGGLAKPDDDIAVWMVDRSETLRPLNR